MTNNLELRLQTPVASRIPECEATVVGEGSDDVSSVLAALCMCLERVEGVKFLVSGFGEADWRASVGRDLCLLLEQLPALAKSIDGNESEFSIEFVEQGFFRTLTFSGKSDGLTVFCTSGDDWTPSPATASMSRKELARMLNNLSERFVSASHDVCPQLVGVPSFVEWRSAVSVLQRVGD